jgi:hypothetical protein
MLGQQLYHQVLPQPMKMKNIFQNLVRSWHDILLGITKAKWEYNPAELVCSL